MIYEKKDRDNQIAKMEAVSSAFYGAATQTGVHAFIEFCGLMNEFIKMCQATSEAGKDFNESNTHTGVSLDVRPHHIAYLAEKFDCIFGPTLLNDEMRETFFNGMGWEEKTRIRERKKLVGVAIRDTEDRIWSLPAPLRHMHVQALMREHGAKQKPDNHWNQGFIDEDGKYLTRRQAMVNAELHKQIKGGQLINPAVLTSEDLW